MRPVQQLATSLVRAAAAAAPARASLHTALYKGVRIQQLAGSINAGHLLHSSSRVNQDEGRKPGTPGFEETAKQQWQSYHKWRQHFRWRREAITQFLRDYSLWTALGLLAYYNLGKRQELQAYEAGSFVIIDDLEGKIQELDPSNRLLAGSYRAQHAKADVGSDDKEDLETSQESQQQSATGSSNQQGTPSSSTEPKSGGVFF
ncbi:hypothetical protein GQ54DRAFT_297166 [Martensiomyces pterosporus]|nr:hypothetical protein GQ54DRAFT_297166 [Martensiomyces pterosporus]